MYTFMFLQQGTPDIYYGSEYGMAGKQDPDNRKPMEWRPEKQDHDMYQFMQGLIQLRKDYLKVLVEGDLAWQIDGEVISFTREIDGERVLAVFNTGKTDYPIANKSGQVVFSHRLADQLLAANGFVVIVESRRENNDI
jgi:neopullulanase